MRTFTIQLLGVVRYLRPDRNPLRRPIDRVHVRLVLVLGSLFLILAPLTVVVTARLAGNAGLRAERVQSRTRHRADAVVVDDSPNGSRGVLDETVRIGWRDPAGAAHTAVVPTVEGDTVGTHRSIWIDQPGRLTTRPRKHSQTIADSVMAALTAVTLLGLAHSAARTLIERRLDRRRLELWEREWVAVAPRWTGLP
ncbi:MAG: hypothetical protein JWP48_1549 [Actinoallomurus sp.]|jgi:hypothetical protein|nr:hypothetical protein [Actinoallomurus sp.]